jgi:hypothetical protein
MAINPNESLLQAAFAPARTLEPSNADIARVIARAKVPSKRSANFRAPSGWRRFAVPGIAALALLFAGTYAVPATRAAIDDFTGNVADAFSGWMGGDSADAPGRPLGANEQAPDYFRDGSWAKEHINEPRVIAEAGGYKLFAYLESSGTVGFDLGDTGVGMGGYRASDFNGKALDVLGPSSMSHADAQGHVPLFGITARSVTSVELTYDSGPPLRVDGVDGGFVLLVEPGRGPREVDALDAQGDVLGSKTIDGPGWDWQHYVSAASP